MTDPPALPTAWQNAVICASSSPKFVYAWEVGSEKNELIMSPHWATLTADELAMDPAPASTEALVRL